MPQSILDNLKALALRGVPKVDSQQDSENQTLRAKAIQDTWSPMRRKAIGAIDTIGEFGKGLLLDDPATDESFGSHGTARAIGGLANTLPLMGAMGSLKKLPIIAPEAYQDVKAGGLRLYSRLTDTFAKAPAKMKPAKAISLAQSGASREEINLRKLNEFLKGRDPMGDIPREEIMGHLKANPLELEVTRKSSKPRSLDPRAQADQELAVLEHELDTEYGGQWDLTNITPEQRARHEEITRRIDAGTTYDNPSDWAPTANQVEYDFMQTPGPSENYGESLIKLPDRSKNPTPNLSASTDDPIVRDYLQARGPDFEATDQDFQRWYQDNVGPMTNFQSGHFSDDPNTLVWSRHNDRRLNPTSTTPAELADPFVADLMGVPNDRWPIKAAYAEGGSKGRFIEEIQSDWGQAGRDRGFNTPDEQARRAAANAANKQSWQAVDNFLDQLIESHPEQLGYIQRNWERHGKSNGVRMGLPKGSPEIAQLEELERQARASDHYINENFSFQPVPDMPFKDTYHELALKQQLLDAANDPSLEWLGVADAHTNAAMEGHGTTPRKGTTTWYDEKHPSALEKLLNPLGGNVEFANLGDSKMYGVQTGTGSVTGGYGVIANTQPEGNFQVIADVIPNQNGLRLNDNQAWSTADKLVDTVVKQDNHIPGPGMWKANLTPELKELIKTRGFPAMVALMGLRTAIEPNKPE